MPKSFLVKRLTKIAAKVIQDTRTAGRVPANAQEEYELIEIAYGGSAVEVDFEKWLNELKQNKVIPTYPITEYLKVIHDRLRDKNFSTSLVIPTQTAVEKQSIQQVNEYERHRVQSELEKKLAEIKQDEENITALGDEFVC